MVNNRPVTLLQSWPLSRGTQEEVIKSMQATGVQSPNIPEEQGVSRQKIQKVLGRYSPADNKIALLAT